MKTFDIKDEMLIRYVTHHFIYLFSFILHNIKHIHLNSIFEISDDTELIDCCGTETLINKRKRPAINNQENKSMKYSNVQNR